ncbi:hypothetical protein Clacol_008214 [Clathrus columnatus]|uniref:GYF domain-containing protein n=1 Tax=Clathrus columnatus TaxID=1419009 RepID=A0AAV5AJM7_9AGAM|nr:hypothetical protein Clacol_008214 [Clathrus columnatus]
MSSLQFGPEWMRSKQASMQSPLTRLPHTTTLTPQSNAVLSSSLYSSLVTNNNSLEHEKESSHNPFQYSKEDMLQVWRDGGGRGALGVEIELWEGVVKELGGDPIGLKELSESERKLFSSPLNSELRRRQSHDVLPNSLERPKLGISASNGQTSFGQSRFSPLLARRRKEESTDLIVPVLRRLSLSSPLSLIGGPIVPDSVLPSPHTKLGTDISTFDSIISEGNCRNQDDRRGVMLDNIPGADHNKSGEGQTDGFKIQHTVATFQNESVDRDPKNPEDLQAVTTLGGFSSLEDVFDKHNDNIKLDEYHNQILQNSSGFSMNRPPGFELDPASITWLYRDPKGNTQGPFSATLMQKWYDEGYFAPDLLVKRSYLDNEWIMVGELAIRDLNGKLFLQLYPEYPLSGLFSRGSVLHDAQPLDHFRHSSGQSLVLSDSQAADHSKLQTAFHQRGVTDHVSIMDSHSNTLSPSVQTASNTSLLSTPPSPELFFNHSMSSRTAALQPGIERPTTLESASTSRSGALAYGRLVNPELSHLIPVGTLQASPNARKAHFNNAFQSAWGRNLQAPHNETIITQNQATHKDPIGREIYGSLNAESAYIYPPTSSVTPISPVHGKGGSLDPPKATTCSDDSLRDADSNSTGMFLRNTDLLREPFAFLYDRPVVGEEPSQTLLNHHIPQSSQLYSLDNPQPVNLVPSRQIEEIKPTESVEPLHSDEKTDRTQQQFSSGQETGISQKPIHRVGTNPLKSETSGESPHPTPEPIETEVGPEPILDQLSLSVVPDSTILKPAWKTTVSYGDEMKSRMREIQEAESKKSGARKLNDREKDQNSLSINAYTEETAGFPSTWGLPVSQTGSSRLLKEPTQQHQLSAPSVHALPVWPNTGKPIPIKKSMREIQEEEEQKKKALVKEKETAQIANRRAYAESTNKPSVSQSSNGAWTTVGAGGRHSALVPSSTTQSTTRLASTAHTSPQSAITIKAAANRPPPSIPPNSKVLPKSNSSPIDNTPFPPSPEFMRWLRDSLRGFNPGFNTEEFMTMLLAFPLDFPSSTVEVIQDMVYMNSVTMDGRRFATEFCDKRKADAANRSKNANGKQPSLADVLRYVFPSLELDCDTSKILQMSAHVENPVR